MRTPFILICVILTLSCHFYLQSLPKAKTLVPESVLESVDNELTHLRDSTVHALKIDGWCGSEQCYEITADRLEFVDSEIHFIRTALMKNGILQNASIWILFPNASELKCSTPQAQFTPESRSIRFSDDLYCSENPFSSNPSFLILNMHERELHAKGADWELNLKLPKGRIL